MRACLTLLRISLCSIDQTGRAHPAFTIRKEANNVVRTAEICRPPSIGLGAVVILLVLARSSDPDRLPAGSVRITAQLINGSPPLQNLSADPITLWLWPTRKKVCTSNMSMR